MNHPGVNTRAKAEQQICFQPAQSADVFSSLFRRVSDRVATHFRRSF